MAIVVASAATRVSTSPATTASISVSVGDLLIASFSAFTDTTITDSQGGNTWTQVVGNSSDGIVLMRVSTAGNLTVTATESVPIAMTLKVYKATGASSNIGASGSGTSSTNNLTANVFTSTKASSYAVVHAYEGNDLGASTSSDLTIDRAEIAGAWEQLDGFKALAGAGAQTANLDAAGAGTADWNWWAVEIVPSGTAMPIFQRTTPRVWTVR